MKSVLGELILNQQPQLERAKVQEMCEKMLETLDRPAGIVLYWGTDDEESVQIIQSSRLINPKYAMKALTWATNDYAQKIV